MTELRQIREGRGLSLDTVAREVRIPRRYLVAMEEGDLSVLPPGPFRRGYNRQYRDYLGLPALPEDPSLSDAPDPPDTGADRPNGTGHAQDGGPDLPLIGELSEHSPQPFHEDTTTTLTIPKSDEIPVARLIVTGFILTIGVVLSLRIGSHYLDQPPVDPTADLTTVSAGDDAPVAELAGHKVKVRAIESTHVTVHEGEETRRTGILRGGDTFELQTEDTISVEMGSLRTVVVHYNNERIEPLHNLSHGRRLVFVQDVEE